jgi:hypothetical protein
MHPELSSSYTIEYQDHLAGGYEYDVIFDNGARLQLGIHGNWPECPDDVVIRAETLQYIRIGHLQLGHWPAQGRARRVLRSGVGTV